MDLCYELVYSDAGYREAEKPVQKLLQARREFEKQETPI